MNYLGPGPLHLPPVRHCPSNASQPCNINHLLVPAQQHTHGRAGRLVRGAWPARYLAEARGLWGHLAGRSGGAGAGCRCHTLVPDQGKRRSRPCQSHVYSGKGSIEMKSPERPDGITHRYFMSTSSSSLPPSLPYMRWSMGVISLALIDCKTSTTVCRCASCNIHNPPRQRHITTSWLLLTCVVPSASVGAPPLPLELASHRSIPLAFVSPWVGCKIIPLPDQAHCRQASPDNPSGRPPRPRRAAAA